MAAEAAAETQRLREQLKAALARAAAAAAEQVGWNREPGFRVGVDEKLHHRGHPGRLAGGTAGATGCAADSLCTHHRTHPFSWGVSAQAPSFEVERRERGQAAHSSHASCVTSTHWVTSRDVRAGRWLTAAASLLRGGFRRST